MIFGVGIDSIEIERVKKAVQRSPRFLGRVFTEREIADCVKKTDYFASLAVRFAAKEAVSKALGITMWLEKWRQIEIGQVENIPVVTLTGEILSAAQEKGIISVHISLSHDKTRAIAFAVAEK